MQKTVVIMSLLLFLTVGSASAQQLGSIGHLVKQGEVNIGFQFADLFKQQFEDYNLKRTYSDGETSTSKKGTDFEDDKYFMATFTYGIIDQINIFARVGMVNGGKFMDYQDYNDWKGSLESNFVWSIGAKGRIFEFDNGLGFCVTAQYTRYDDREINNWKSVDTGESAEDLGWTSDDSIDYWQVDAIATAYWDLEAFTPYVGAGYTYYKVDFNGKWTHDQPDYGWIKYDSSFENDDKFTALIGLDVDLRKNIKANIQGTFVSSTAFTAGLSFSF